MEEKKEEYRIYHKIEPNRKVRVFKSNYKGTDYYKIQVRQKNYDETEDIFYQNVVFKKGITLDDPDNKGVDIIIKKAYENCRKNPKDAYNPIFYLMITEFELVERESQKKAAALEKFNENLTENEMEEVANAELPF